MGLCVAGKADKRVPSTTPYRHLLGSVTSWLNGISYTKNRIKTPCSSPWALMRLANSHSVCPVHATDKKPHGLVILISSLWLMTNRKSAHMCMLNEKAHQFYRFFAVPMCVPTTLVPNPKLVLLSCQWACNGLRCSKRRVRDDLPAVEPPSDDCKR